MAICICQMLNIGPDISWPDTTAGSACLVLWKQLLGPAIRHCFQQALCWSPAVVECLRRERAAECSSIRRRLALACLYENLCGSNAVIHSQVKGVERPKANCYEGETSRWTLGRRSN